jgi:glycosyltransferase involved in cell wall biosynthesis
VNAPRLNVVLAGPFGLRPRGTMAVRALPMAKALARRGHRVTLLLPPWQNPEDAGRCWEEDGVRVENLHLPPSVPGLFHASLALRMARRTLVLRPDVIHLFKPKAYSGLVHTLLAQLPPRRRPRLVVDTDDWEGPGGWNELADYSPLQRRFFTWQERWGLTHADRVTAASRVLEGLVWALGVPRDRVVYVPNGIAHPELIPPAERGPAPTSPRILLYTRFFEFPVARVIELLRRVRERVPEAHLQVVGKGLFGEEEDLMAQARRAGLVEAVTYTGWVEPEEQPRIFAQAALAVYPFDDTLINRTKCPVKLLDLMTAGVPVVGEAVGEIRETIRHAETGWLVEPGDVDAFAAGVVRLLEDRALRERIGRAATQAVQRERTWERLVERVERAYSISVRL